MVREFIEKAGATLLYLSPFVRGKAGKTVEFGAKLAASCFEGYIFLDRISWDNFNESGDFKAQIEAYRHFTGFYPESVHVDKIYRTRERRSQLVTKYS